MRRPVSLLAALLLGSAAGATVLSSPAGASACAAGSGVTVVVGSSVSCDANGGGPAAANFRDAGHTLTPVDRQPGFVCQVDGAPSSANCVNTPPSNAYWGLFWSDGTSGTWTYASQGAGSLKVPAGGWVAFVFQDSGTRTAPSVNPVSAKPVAKPTAAKPEPTVRATKKPAPRPSATKPAPATPAPRTTAPSATPSPSAAAPSTVTPTPATSETPAADGPTPTPETSTTAPESTDDTTPTAAQADESGGGSLGWVAGALVVALLGGMGAVLWRRRSSGATGGPS